MSVSRREAMWLSCAKKTCCHTSVIIPTGRDVWRISRTLDAPPSSFLVLMETPAPRRDAFALDASKRRFRFALAKARAPKRSPACVFLLRTRTGQHRCGLAELRPLVCQTFPCTIASGMLVVADGEGCSCRRWSIGDVDIDDELPLVHTRQAESEEYCDLVARWNRRVDGGLEGPSATVDRFLTFVFAHYDDAEQTS